MRIAVFTNKFPGRVSTFFARDMRGLIEAGIEVDIFPIYPLDPTIWHFVPDLLNEKVLPRSRVHHLTFGECLKAAQRWPSKDDRRFLGDLLSTGMSAISHGINSFAKSSYVSLKAWAWAQKLEKQYDHVLAYWGNYAATGAYIFHRLLRQQIPFTMFLHAGIDLYQNRVFLQQKLSYADNIVVVCDFNRQFLKNIYPDLFEKIECKIHVHHLGLDIDAMSYVPNSRPSHKIIAVGRLEQQKGFDDLLRAVGELKRRDVDVEVELVGDGSELKSLRSLAGQLNLDDRVIFRGWLDFTGVREAMTNATLLCHPSPGLGDAVPTVIKESMALGTPVIATNVAGIPELLDYGNCGVLIPPKDIRALANAIEMFLTNEKLRIDYAANARAHAEKMFNMRANGRRLAELLSSTKRQDH